MKTTLFWAGLAIAILLLGAAFGSAVRVVYASTGANNDNCTRMTQCTDVKTQTFDCHASTDSISFSVRPRLLRGQVAWVLLDPAGAIRWSSQARAPYWFSHTRRFEAVPGEWKLKVAVVEASGEYRTTWQAE